MVGGFVMEDMIEIYHAMSSGSLDAQEAEPQRVVVIGVALVGVTATALVAAVAGVRHGRVVATMSVVKRAVATAAHGL
jgi:hypothetical protein